MILFDFLNNSGLTDKRPGFQHNFIPFFPLLQGNIKFLRNGKPILDCFYFRILNYRRFSQPKQITNSSRNFKNLISVLFFDLNKNIGIEQRHTYYFLSIRPLTYLRYQRTISSNPNLKQPLGYLLLPLGFSVHNIPIHSFPIICFRLLNFKP